MERFFFGILRTSNMNVSTSSLILSISSPCPSTSASSSKSKKAYLFFIPGTIGKPIIINSHLILNYKLRKGLCHTQIQMRHISKKYKDIFYFARHLQFNSCIFLFGSLLYSRSDLLLKVERFKLPISDFSSSLLAFVIFSSCFLNSMTFLVLLCNIFNALSCILLYGVKENKRSQYKNIFLILVDVM